MPVQRTICGYPVRLAMPPRRFQFLFALIFILIATTLLYGPPTTADIPSYADVKDAVKNPQAHLPKLEDLKPSLPDVPNLNPFGPSAHKPPVQKNSNATSPYGAISWIWDSKWSHPFSSSVSLDEDTAVLPPLKARPFIYTYYEPAKGQTKDVAEAENRLVLAWRRAWWAQGFKPMVLSRAEAMKHPQYELVQRLKLGKIDEAVETEVLRWLAWGQMKGGILASWLALPMAAYDNPILGFLRNAEYPDLSRIDGLQDALFFGDEAAVEDAIKKAVKSPLFKNTTASHDKIVSLKKDAGAMVNLLGTGKDGIKTEAKSHGIAYYSKPNVEYIYKPLADGLTNATSADGLALLATLINSHLHLTFQETYPDGVAVVKPLPEHTTALMYEALETARNLTQCPASPIPKSCPPNHTGCKPCDPSKPMKLALLAAMKNDTKMYTIGTVPHPYTLDLLHYMVDSVDEEFLRREVGPEGRDLWVNALTADIFSSSSDKSTDGEGDRKKKKKKNEASTNKAIVYFKSAVAAPHSPPTSLWLTAERVSQADLDWIFGFALPQSSSPDAKPQQPDPSSPLTIFPRPAAPVQVEGVEIQQERYIRAEEARLQKARDAIKATDKLWKGVIKMVEQWSMGDAEVWRFARAFSARRRRERKDWEEEERNFAGSERKSGVGGGSRWSDYLPGRS